VPAARALDQMADYLRTCPAERPIDGADHSASHDRIGSHAQQLRVPVALKAMVRRAVAETLHSHHAGRHAEAVSYDDWQLTPADLPAQPWSEREPTLQAP